MVADRLEPAPRTWIEKTYGVAGFYISLMIAVAVTVPWQSLRSSPLYFSLLFPVTLLVYLVMSLLVRPLKLQRIARNTERGILECSLRPAPNSLPRGYSVPGSADKRGWISGHGTMKEGSLIFQPMAAFTRYSVGETLVLPNVEPLTGGLRTPTTAPWYLGRKRTVVYVKTDSGIFEVSGSAEELKSVRIYPTEPSR